MLSSKIWHRFIVFLPVILILTMISMIYITYLATYIAILISADKSKEVNFLLGFTSSVSNSPTKGYVLLGITLFFLVFLVWAILKTVLTDPGYFPEPMDLEYKLISNSIEDIMDFNPYKRTEEDIKQTITYPSNNTRLDNKQKNSSNKNNKKNLNTKDYMNLEEEFDFENDDYTRDKNSSTKLVNKEKQFFMKDTKNIGKDPFDNYNYKKNINDNELNRSNRSNKSNESHTLIVNFTNSVTEGPLNYIEFNEYHRSIDKFYDAFNKKKDESNQDIYLMTQKNNDEIIENNKNSLMEKRKHKNNEMKIDIIDIYKGVDISRLNQCGTCQRVKIERSHHCKMCQKCVLKMDHHCPWLANCIGFSNYKFFCLVHFYGTISTGLIFLTYWETVVNLHLNYNTNVMECVFVDFVYMTNFALMAFLMWLLWVNTRLVFNGETIIEQSDRERFPSSKSFNIYDMGWKRNFTNIFGDRWYTWFIPAFPNVKGHGLMFETKKSFFIDK